MSLPGCNRNDNSYRDKIRNPSFIFKGATSSCILKKLAKVFKIVISNPFQSSPSSAILAPFCSGITPLVFSSVANNYF